MATTVDYLAASEKFFGQLGISSDVNSASISFNKYLAENTTADARSAAIAIVNIAESLVSVIKEIPVLGNVINIAALTNDINALYATVNSNGATNDKVSAVIGDLFAVGAVASVALGPAALPLFIGLSTLSLTASFYSTHAGIINDQQNAALLRWATDSINDLSLKDYAKWDKSESSKTTAYKLAEDKSALTKLTLRICARSSVAPFNFAPSRLQPSKFAENNSAPVKSIPERSSPERSFLLRLSGFLLLALSAITCSRVISAASKGRLNSADIPAKSKRK